MNKARKKRKQEKNTWYKRKGKLKRKINEHLKIGYE
jgi:hypothetical protein